MGSILDYIDWRGDILFSERSFNEVDNLIFSELAYVNMDGLMADRNEIITIGELYRRYVKAENKSNIPLNDPFPLFKKAAVCDRFKSIRLTRYVDIIDAEKQLQCSAVTFILEDKSLYIAFRGTDGTITGWREDCNFSFLSETAGQKAAVQYVNETAEALEGSIRIGGHSKGGNFAVYSSAFCNEEIRKNRITEVYSNDGPGFNSVIAGSEQYREILPKVKKIMPESSLVGILLSSAEEKKVVKSTAKGIYQHHPCSWCVTGVSFVEADGLSTESMLMSETLQKWLGGLSDDERKTFVASVFDTIEASGAATLAELNKNRLVSYNAILKAAAQFSPERRNEIFKILKNLAKTGGEVFFNEAKKTFEKIMEPQQKDGLSTT